MYIIIKSYAQYNFQGSEILGVYDNKTSAITMLQKFVLYYKKMTKNVLETSDSTCPTFYSFTNIDDIDNTDWCSKNYFHTWFEIQEV